jgi:hypothetical protein
MRKSTIPLLLSMVLMAALASCQESTSGRTTSNDHSMTAEEISNDSSLKEVSGSIAADKATTIRTEIRFPVGELKVTPGSTTLVDGTYRFYLKKWLPEVSYAEDGQTGRLQIAADDKSFGHQYGHLDQSDWDIKLSRKLRNDLTISCVAGEGTIDLRQCNLERFDFSMTAGEMEIDLRDTSIPEFSFKALAGEAVIDLSGDWDNDLHASLRGGVGEMTLKLPSGTGIRLDVHGILGDVDASGLEKDNGYYTNDAFGKTQENLYIEFSGGIGSLEVILVD